MILTHLLKDIYTGIVPDLFTEMQIRSVRSDSRQVDKESIFVAVRGPNCNGEDFIDHAIRRGVRVVACERLQSQHVGNPLVCFLKVDNAQKFLVAICDRFHKEPSRKLNILGVTGTNGKTTISYVVEHILKAAKKECGIIGTIGHRIKGRVFSAVNTTPGLVESYCLHQSMVNHSIEHCVMEVSSHALKQGRVEGIHFRSAIFTNLTKEHLDYHETMEDYFNSKAILFRGLSKEGLAVVNMDDPYGRKLIKETKAKIITYAIDESADLQAHSLQYDREQTKFKITIEGKDVLIKSKLIGRFNVYNLLAAIAYCLHIGIECKLIQSSISSLTAVPGRLERIDWVQNFTVLIDYAHTQDALENVLKAIKQVSNSRIILVFGCGGDRDKLKRPAMGKVASSYADFSIVTSDNPRGESPERIIDNIIPGFENDNYEVIVDRKNAIKKALTIARDDDIVLLAGKGHETYQVFKDEVIEFDEKQIVKDFLISRK